MGTSGHSPRCTSVAGALRSHIPSLLGALRPDARPLLRRRTAPVGPTGGSWRRRPGTSAHVPAPRRPRARPRRRQRPPRAWSRRSAGAVQRHDAKRRGYTVALARVGEPARFEQFGQPAGEVVARRLVSIEPADRGGGDLL